MRCHRTPYPSFLCPDLPSDQQRFTFAHPPSSDQASQTQHTLTFASLTGVLLELSMMATRTRMWFVCGGEGRSTPQEAQRQIRLWSAGRRARAYTHSANKVCRRGDARALCFVCIANTVLLIMPQRNSVARTAFAAARAGPPLTATLIFRQARHVVFTLAPPAYSFFFLAYFSTGLPGDVVHASVSVAACCPLWFVPCPGTRTAAKSWR